MSIAGHSDSSYVCSRPGEVRVWLSFGGDATESESVLSRESGVAE